MLGISLLSSLDLKSGTILNSGYCISIKTMTNTKETLRNYEKYEMDQRSGSGLKGNIRDIKTASLESHRVRIDNEVSLQVATTSTNKPAAC